MDWLGKILGNILPNEIKASLNVGDIKFLSDNTVDKSTTINNNTLVFVNASPETVEKVIEAARKNMNIGDLIIEEDSNQTLQDVTKALDSSAAQNDIDVFKSIVPRKDLPILEAAIVIRHLHESGKSVEKYKRQVVQQYGSRGNMICNLYSADYFHTLILPAYEDIGKNSEHTFLSIYEYFVTESPLAMFVGTRTGAEGIKANIIEKIKDNKKVGIGYLNIHGIGKANLKNIKKALEDPELSKLLKHEPHLESTKNVHKVVIYF